MKLFIDDIRQVTASDKEQYNIARNFDEVKTQMIIKPTFIDIDYDMGFDQPTGLDILKWMKENNCDEFIEQINLHSSDPSGRSKMKQYIEANFKNINVTTNHN